MDIQDSFRSTELVSSRGERFYINTLNWGVTGGYQYTVVSKDRNRLKERGDTIAGIKGLSPFVYRFSQDTLYLYYQEEKAIDIGGELHSVEINYFPLDNTSYMDVLNKASKGVEGYRLVP
ncbi:hypothetical protein [Sphingobacterium endophyticum]|uniref:hypothetical protein n=1 Tax=Sphingobacterium endophyticum TaxID=2546448 RepID=UPI0012E177E1|nr:hypothetical protein [Sphingobacterium endophyticum]